jgi:hypothetical protein
MMPVRTWLRRYILFELLASLSSTILILSCAEQPTQNPVGNLPPDTHLFLVMPDSTTLPDTTSSRQEVYWWGQDPDGEVVGYQYRWDFDSSWVETTDENAVFYLPLREQFDIFTFQVRAIDNEGAIDPTPAQLTFPVFNTPPSIVFRVHSNPTGNPQDTTTTFPTRTFIWEVADLDGDSTITGLYWTLDDTTHWDYLAGWVRSITLTDVEPGFHTFYIFARDTAGATSATIQFPDTSDHNAPNFWLVQEPIGYVVLVDDDDRVSGINEDVAREFYMAILDTLTPSGYSVWDVSRGLPYSSADILASLSYFDKAIWFCDPNSNLADGSSALTSYMEGGGHVIVFSTDLGEGANYDDPPFEFSHIDSVTNQVNRISNNNIIESQIEPFPDLNATGFGFIPDDLSDTLYILIKDPDPCVGLRYPAGGPASLIFCDFPLHRVDGLHTAGELLNYVLFTEFSQPVSFWKQIHF